MSIGDILWLFFMFSALQPIIRQKMLVASRLRVLNRFERARKSRAIALVHRQETMSLLGFPLMRYIDVNDSEDVLRAIKLTDPDCPIDLIVHTPGGLVLAAGQIAHALKRHRAKVTVFVPHYAMSGGTLISLAADEIVMDPNAVLGPVDPQLGQSAAASVLTVLERKKPEDIEDQTLILADVARKAIVQVTRTVQDLLGERMNREQAGSLAAKLATGTWTHDYGDHGRGGQVARPADQHRDAGGSVRLHGPLRAADAHAAVGGIRADALSRRRSPSVLDGELMEVGTLSGVMDDLTRQGFTEQFAPANGELRGVHSGSTFRPGQVAIAEYYRFEGVSDPDDMSILYAIETRSGVRGTLADAFGAYADPRVGAFLRDVAVRRSRRPDTPGDTGPG